MTKKRNFERDKMIPLPIFTLSVSLLNSCIIAHMEKQQTHRKKTNKSMERIKKKKKQKSIAFPIQCYEHAYRQKGHHSMVVTLYNLITFCRDFVIF